MAPWESVNIRTEYLQKRENCNAFSGKDVFGPFSSIEDLKSSRKKTGMARGQGLGLALRRIGFCPGGTWKR
jgi:hypothetical protein